VSGGLSDRNCVPCRGGIPPLGAEQVEQLRRQISEEWSVVDGHHLVREVKLKNFRQAMALANRVAEIAEAQGHHPDLLVSWGKLTVTLFTHAINGLHENDFIMAARVDALLSPSVP
jgi:4a-hydroxytetrahydrobiopterin dehydratase